MHDAVLVRCGKRGRNLRRVLERLRRRHRTTSDQRVEARAVDQLHRDERRAVVFVDLVDGDDVRMVERGGGARFLDEAAMPIDIGRGIGRQHLDRHRPSEPRVVGGIDHAHAAASDLGVDAVMRNLTRHSGRIIVLSVSSPGGYSCRRATIGSTRMARRAGM